MPLLAEPSARQPCRARRPFSLDTRPDWMNAVRREDARHVRYGRPASVVLLELTMDATGLALDAIASDVADVICESGARAPTGPSASPPASFADPDARNRRATLRRPLPADSSGRTGRRPSGDNGETLHIEIATCPRARLAQRGARGRRGALGIVDPRRMSSSA